MISIAEGREQGGDEMNQYSIDKMEVNNDVLSFQIKGPDGFSIWVHAKRERIEEILHIDADRRTP
jgi:hypothetical protein